MDTTDVAAIVTGGASGLGGATVRRLASEGARVIAIDLPKAIENAEPLDGVEYVGADVTDPDQVASAVDAAVATGLPLRIAVSCAGIGTPGRVVGKEGPLDLEKFTSVITVNLIGTFNVLRLAAARMVEAEPLDDGLRGVIVNTASIAAWEGQIGQIAYAASKGGVVGLTLPAARDLAQHGIRVVSIAPGLVDTPLLQGLGEEFRQALADGIPFPKRLGRPDEFARMVSVIVEHDYLNGEVIRMDGALRMAPR